MSPGLEDAGGRAAYDSEGVHHDNNETENGGAFTQKRDGLADPAFAAWLNLKSNALAQ
jgi:hypothetical protein